MVWFTIFLTSGLATFAGCGLRLLLHGPRATAVSCLIVIVGASCMSAIAANHASIQPLAVAAGMVMAILQIDMFSNRYRLSLIDKVNRSLEISRWLGDHFDELDGGKKGLIYRVDLMEALDSNVHNSCERDMLSLAMRDLDYIGHPVPSTMVPCPPAVMGGAVARSFPHYAIGRKDLASYPERIRAELAREFGKSA